jgi:hypothetical protein
MLIDSRKLGNTFRMTRAHDDSTSVEDYEVSSVLFSVFQDVKTKSFRVISDACVSSFFFFFFVSFCIWVCYLQFVLVLTVPLLFDLAFERERRERNIYHRIEGCVRKHVTNKLK